MNDEEDGFTIRGDWAAVRSRFCVVERGHVEVNRTGFAGGHFV
jgi:hypothetical protein